MKFVMQVALGLLLFGQIGCGRSTQKSEGIEGVLDSKEAPLVEARKLSDVRFTPPVVKADAEAMSTDGDDQLEASADKEAALADDMPAPPPSPATPPAPTSTSGNAARLLVYQAEVRLKTAKMPRAMSRLDSLVRRSGGYLSAAAETRADGEWRQETTIRVPPARFQTLLSGLAGLGTIEEKKLSTDDVTAEHADISARLQSKRAVEKQYTTLLGKAQKIKDILDIEEKLGEVREEIEATESRLKTLNSEVAYSTIALTLYQPLPQSVPDAPVVSLGSRTVEAFYGGWQLLTSLFIGAINLWPVLLLGAGGWWLWHRRRAKRLPPPAPPVA
jgi:hypothetical protein